MDFALILVVLTAVSGFVWGAEILYRRVLRSEEGGRAIRQYSSRICPFFFPGFVACAGSAIVLV